MNFLDLKTGLKAELPIALGVLPFGLIFGASIIPMHVDPVLGLAMSAVIFAGSAQFLTLQLLAQSTPVALIALIALITNLRHILYSFSLADFWTTQPRWRQVLLSYLLTDECYAALVLREKDKPLSWEYFFACGFTLWFFWQISTWVGFYLGSHLPPDLGLERAVDFLFLAIVTKLLKTRIAVATSLLAAVSSGLLQNVAFKLNILIAIAIAFAFLLSPFAGERSRE